MENNLIICFFLLCLYLFFFVLSKIFSLKILNFFFLSLVFDFFEFKELLLLLLLDIVSSIILILVSSFLSKTILNCFSKYSSKSKPRNSLGTKEESKGSSLYQHKQ